MGMFCPCCEMAISCGSNSMESWMRKMLSLTSSFKIVSMALRVPAVVAVK